HPCGRGVHVGLEVAVAELHRVGERGQRVLQPAGCAAPVGERDGTGMVEKSEACRHAHPTHPLPLQSRSCTTWQSPTSPQVSATRSTVDHAVTDTGASATAMYVTA